MSSGEGKREIRIKNNHLWLVLRIGRRTMDYKTGPHSKNGRNGIGKGARQDFGRLTLKDMVSRLQKITNGLHHVLSTKRLACSTIARGEVFSLFFFPPSSLRAARYARRGDERHRES